MIFNKTKKGSAELYNLTGTWYKANDFTGISEDIVLAQNEVIKLIGKADIRPGTLPVYDGRI